MFEFIMTMPEDNLLDRSTRMDFNSEKLITIDGACNKLNQNN